MSDILGPPTWGVKTPPTTCAEYLGKALGYCPGAVQIISTHDGRGFCTDHARERDL